MYLEFIVFTPDYRGKGRVLYFIGVERGGGYPTLISTYASTCPHQFVGLRYLNI